MGNLFAYLTNLEFLYSMGEYLSVPNR